MKPIDETSVEVNIMKELVKVFQVTKQVYVNEDEEIGISADPDGSGLPDFTSSDPDPTPERADALYVYVSLTTPEFGDVSLCFRMTDDDETRLVDVEAKAG